MPHMHDAMGALLPIQFTSSSLSERATSLMIRAASLGAPVKCDTVSRNTHCVCSVLQFNSLERSTGHLPRVTVCIARALAASEGALCM